MARRERVRVLVVRTDLLRPELEHGRDRLGACDRDQQAVRTVPVPAAQREAESGGRDADPEHVTHVLDLLGVALGGQGRPARKEPAGQTPGDRVGTTDQVPAELRDLVHLVEADPLVGLRDAAAQVQRCAPAQCRSIPHLVPQGRGPEGRVQQRPDRRKLEPFLRLRLLGRGVGQDGSDRGEQDREQPCCE